MAKLTLTDLTSLTNQTSAVAAINANYALIETAMENTLSRDGTSPNTMTADIDLNSNSLLNVDDIDAVSITLDGTDLETVFEGHVADAEAAQAAAEAAQAAAVTAQNNAQTAETNAETAETNAELAETNAETAQAAAEAALASIGTAISDEIGVTLQAYDAQLTDIAALAVTDGNVIVGNGSTWVAESGATARTSLGLGTAAVKNTGTSGDAVPLLNGVNTWSGVQTFLFNGIKSNNAYYQFLNSSGNVVAAFNTFGGATAPTSYLVLEASAGVSYILNGGSATNADTVIAARGTGATVVRSNNLSGSVLATFASTGEVTMPLQPAVLVTLAAATSNDKTGDGTLYKVLFDTEIFDQGGDYGSSTFTAPVTGKYQFSGQVKVANMVAHTDYAVYLQTSNRTFILAAVNPLNSLGGGSTFSIPFSALVDLDANDIAQISVLVAGSTKTVGVAVGADSTDIRTFFSINLVC